jgi:Peptide N-acetyl-beta-D-glucosaminyl asparaginase amidase A
MEDLMKHKSWQEGTVDRDAASRQESMDSPHDELLETGGHRFSTAGGSDRVDHHGFLMSNEMVKMALRRFLLGAHRRLAFLALTTIFLLSACFGIARESSLPVQSLNIDVKSTKIYRRAIATTMMDVFEVSAPVTVPADAQKCETTLMTYSFSNSYGKPFVGQYAPCELSPKPSVFTVKASRRMPARVGRLLSLLKLC